MAINIIKNTNFKYHNTTGGRATPKYIVMHYTASNGEFAAVDEHFVDVYYTYIRKSTDAGKGTMGGKNYYIHNCLAVPCT